MKTKERAERKPIQKPAKLVFVLCCCSTKINKKKNSIFTIEMNVRLEQKKNFVSLVRASGPFRFAGIDGDIGTVQVRYSIIHFFYSRHRRVVCLRVFIYAFKGFPLNQVTWTRKQLIKLEINDKQFKRNNNKKLLHCDHHWSWFLFQEGGWQQWQFICAYWIIIFIYRFYTKTSNSYTASFVVWCKY